MLKMSSESVAVDVPKDIIKVEILKLSNENDFKRLPLILIRRSYIKFKSN